MLRLVTTRRRASLTKSRRPMSQAEGLLQVDLALVRNTSHPADPGLHLVTAVLQDLVVRPSPLVVSRQDHQVQWGPQGALPSLLEWARRRLDFKACLHSHQVLLLSLLTAFPPAVLLSLRPTSAGLVALPLTLAAFHPLVPRAPL